MYKIDTNNDIKENKKVHSKIYQNKIGSKFLNKGIAVS